MATSGGGFREPSPGLFSEAVAFLLSDDALAPYEDGYPARHARPVGSGYEGLLIGLFVACYERRGTRNNLQVLFSLYPDVPGENGGEDRAAVAGIRPEEGKDRLVFSMLDLPLRALACRDREDLRRVYEIVLSAREGLRSGLSQHTAFL